MKRQDRQRKLGLRAVRHEKITNRTQLRRPVIVKRRKAGRRSSSLDGPSRQSGTILAAAPDHRPDCGWKGGCVLGFASVGSRSMAQGMPGGNIIQPVLNLARDWTFGLNLRVSQRIPRVRFREVSGRRQRGGGGFFFLMGGGGGVWVGNELRCVYFRPGDHARRIVHIKMRIGEFPCLAIFRPSLVGVISSEPGIRTSNLVGVLAKILLHRSGPVAQETIRESVPARYKQQPRHISRTSAWSIDERRPLAGLISGAPLRRPPGWRRRRSRMGQDARPRECDFGGAFASGLRSTNQ